MRIGILMPLDVQLIKTTIRFDRYVEGFLSLGHEAILVATRTSLEGFPHPAVEVTDRAIFRDSTFWASLHLDVLFICTWLVHAEEMQAARSSINCLISLSDSDGCIGIRAFPTTLFNRMLVIQTTFIGKVRTALWWLRQYFGIDTRVEQEVIASCKLADNIVVFSPGAGKNLKSFFCQQKHIELAERILVVPYPVDEQFERKCIPTNDRNDQVIAIGRWADPQKDGPLLLRALDKLLKWRPITKCIIIGTSGDDVFLDLKRNFPERIMILGHQSQENVMKLLDSSRCLISTSRWESGPIVAAEALLRGCSLVGPESVPSFRQFCVDTECGTMFFQRSGIAVAQALHSELLAWDEGLRSPEQISLRWRGIFTPGSVCAKLLTSNIKKYRKDL